MAPLHSFGLTYFDWRDKLDTGINIQKEINRFLLIDKQLFGLYKVFGEGVLDGWKIKSIDSSNQQSIGSILVGGITEGSISIEIEEGSAIISSLAVETVLPEIVENLPPRETVDIYAVLVGSTVRNRRIRFVWSRSSLFNNSIRIGRVVTGDSSVLSILQDVPFRQTISFKNLIISEIAKHKHRGSPSKIDLQRETKNQLPGARIADFNADQISFGRFDLERMPIFDHNKLLDTGLLSHAQLDTFARLVDSGSRELLGEVAGTNLMKSKLFLKYIYNDVDKYDVNSINIIPGISPNKFIDFDASTSHIDLNSRCISGKPSTITGRLLSVIWDTDEAFLSSFEFENVVIANDQIILDRSTITEKILDSFESPGNNGNPILSFVNEILDDTSNVTITYNGGESSHGFQSAKFLAKQGDRIKVRYNFPNAQNLTDFEKILIDIKSITPLHKSLTVRLINKNPEGIESISDSLIVLSEDKITQDFETKTLSLTGGNVQSFSAFGFEKDNVVALLFETESLLEDFEFSLDKIFLDVSSSFVSSGFIKLRYSGGANVQFNSIIYDAEIKNNSNVRVRMRVSNSPDLLSRSVFSAAVNSGDSFALNGTDAEIEITLFSDPSKKFSPIFNMAELKFTAEGNTQGFVLESFDDWDRGTRTNIDIVNKNSGFLSKIQISNKINVDNLYFASNNVVNELDNNNIPEVGISGSNFLLSPKQALDFGITQGNKGLNFPTSAYRTVGKNFIIADTNNDRVLEISPEGNIVKGIGSHNVFDEDVFFPLTAVYNSRKNIIYCTFSQSVDIDSVNLNNIKLWISGSSFILGSEKDSEVIDNNIIERVLEIKPGLKIEFDLSKNTGDVFIQYLPGAFPISFGKSGDSNKLNTSKGIAVYIADFAYIDGIKKPIFANVLSNNNWIVGNSKINIEKGFSNNSSESFTIKLPVTTNPIITIGNPNEKLPNGVIIDFGWKLPKDFIDITSVSTGNKTWKAEIDAKSITKDLLGKFVILITKIYKDQNGVILQRESIPLSVIITESNKKGGKNIIKDVSSVIEINIDTFTSKFSFDDITFSDFSLGSVFEIDKFQLLICGITKTSVPITEDNPGVDSIPANETIIQQADRKLKSFRGRVFVVDKNSGNINFSYDSPDGLYANDAVLDEKFNYVVAESSFTTNGGRIIKIDPFGNVIFQLGGGVFSSIHDVRSLVNNNLVIST